MADARIVEVHRVGRDPIVARLRQHHDGIAVLGQSLNVMMGCDMKSDSPPCGAPR